MQRLRAIALGWIVGMLAGCGMLDWHEPAAHSSKTHHSTTTAKHAPASGTYVVQRGDTLFSIAFRNQLDYHDLANWNDIGRDYAIHVGQVLRLTPSPDVLSSAPPATAA